MTAGLPTLDPNHGSATVAVTAAAGRLAPISLEALNDTAELLTRVDRKYLVPTEVAAAAVAGLPAGWLALEIDGCRTFRYRSVYFDTDQLDSYLGSARGRRRRFKVRTRTYVDAGVTMLEVKTVGGRGQTVKSRIAHGADESVLDEDACRAVDLLSGRSGLGERLRPTLVTEYRRTTLVGPDDEVRLTLDEDLLCRVPGPSTRSDDRVGPVAPVGFPGRVVLEVKSLGRPTSVDRWLWASGFRPMKLSKFGVGFGALHSDHPSNRWHRIIGSSNALV
jgi:hypothetical protein